MNTMSSQKFINHQRQKIAINAFNTTQFKKTIHPKHSKTFQMSSKCLPPKQQKNSTLLNSTVKTQYHKKTIQEKNSHNCKSPQNSTNNTIGKYRKLDRQDKNIEEEKQKKIIFKKCQIEGNNIFYHNRFEEKVVKNILTFRELSKKLAITLILLWAVLWMIEGLETCPVNAHCGVFIHCDDGYELEGSVCVVSQKIRKNAEVICQISLKNLEYAKGNNECNRDIFFSERKSLEQIVEEYGVKKNRLMVNSIFNWLKSRQNQQKYNFTFNNDIVSPKSARYTLQCYWNFFLQVQYFQAYVILVIVSSLGLFLCSKNLFEEAKAKTIYTSLKYELTTSKELQISKKDISMKFGNFNCNIWKKIDKNRKDDYIKVYEDYQHTRWVID